MKQLLFLLPLLFLSHILPAQSVRISNQDGDWFNPGTWTPNGVPINDDTIIVAHQVTFDSLLIVTLDVNQLRIQPGASLINQGMDQNMVVQSKTFIQQGQLACRNLTEACSLKSIHSGRTETLSAYFSSYTTYINGDLMMDSLILSETTTLDSGGTILVAIDFISSADLNLMARSIVEVGDRFLSGAPLVVDGNVSTVNFTNLEPLSGSGQFCIAGNFQNDGNITGTLDICDASPGGWGDFNSGIIASGITFCANGPCELITGIEDEAREQHPPTVYPNPVADYFKLDWGINPPPSYTVEIRGLTGKLLKSWNADQFNVFYIPELPQGLYLIHVISPSTTFTSRIRLD